MSQNPFVCPHCQSENVMRKSVVYEQGATTGTSKGKGFGIGLNGNVTLMTGKTTNTSITSLATRCAPPKKPMNMLIYGALLGLVIGAAADALIFKNFGTIVFAGIVYFSWKYNKKIQTQWHSEMAEWEKEYICMRCGYEYKSE